jgi:hypothetical protein
VLIKCDKIAGSEPSFDVIEQVAALRWARTATASSAGQDDRSAGRLPEDAGGFRCAGADAPLLPLLPRFARVPPRRRMRYLDRSQPSKASWADVPRLQARQNSLLEAPDGADRRQRWRLARLTVPGVSKSR